MMVGLWLKFIIAAAIVVFSGYRLCIYAEKIAQITKIDRTFIGLILLAVVTSLPELAVAISATKIGALDLAVGDLFGSNLFNLTIVGIIWLVFMKRPKLLSFESTHFMSAGISILLIALAAMGIVFYNLVSAGAGYSNFLVDVESALILVIYIVGVYLVFYSEKGKVTQYAAKPGGRSPSLKLRGTALRSLGEGGRGQSARAWSKFLLYSIILVGSAIYLSGLGDRIARIPVGGVALGGTFVGSLFVAVTTSLPEMAVALSAVKLGFIDMALGDIFGSNMFNMAIISIADLCLGRRIILSAISGEHLFTVLFVLISTALVLASLVYRSKRKAPALAWDSVSILFVFVLANLVNYFLRYLKVQ